MKGGLRKTQQQYCHTDTVQVPIFIDHTSLQVRWQAYSVVGYVRHHGSSVTSGHYTTLRVKGGIWWSMDDAKAPCVLTAEQLALVPRMIYLAILVLPQPVSVPDVAGSGDLESGSHDPSSLRPQPGGARLGGQSSAPSGLPASGAVSGHAETAAGVQRPSLSDNEPGAASRLDQATSAILACASCCSRKSCICTSWMTEPIRVDWDFSAAE